MDNWNFDKAVAFVDAIPDTISKRLTRLFLDAAVIHAAKKVSRPESEFDLLFFVRVVSQITVTDVELVHRVLAGENIDAGWEALAEVLEKELQLYPSGGVPAPVDAAEVV